MGRERKLPVKIQPSISNEVTPSSEADLPPIQPFIDLQNGKSGKDLQTVRFYLYTPTHEEALAAKKMGYHLIGGNSGTSGITSTAIGDYASENISELFGLQLSQLIIYTLAKKNISKSSLDGIVSSIKFFVDFLSNANVNNKNLIDFSIYSIEYDDWSKYRSFLEKSRIKYKKNIFRYVLSIFASFSPTSISGSINSIASPSNKLKVISNDDISSSFGDDGAYSDTVMYQFLAHFISRFDRQIKYLKHYEILCMDFLGKDWIYPINTVIYQKELNKSLNNTLIDRLFSDDEGYEKILDYKLMWFNLLGSYGNKLFVGKLIYFASQSESNQAKYKLYKIWENSTHFLNERSNVENIFGLYVKRSPSQDATGSMNQLAFCLSNIVLIYTGLNKEVVLSWPSKVNGHSILDHKDSLFIRDDVHNKEIEISGIKSRTGVLTKDKLIRVAIVVGSPLFNMLREYEKHAKTNSDGPFFEFSSKNFINNAKVIYKKYPVKDDNGNLMSSFSTTNFRKVFASTKMLEHLKGIKNAQDLAERLRLDLDHNNFDVTLSHYILKSQYATSVLDLAIVTITSEKIRQALEFQGVIAVSQKPKTERSVYLCECADPLNPTHGVAIAKRCTYYDLCLGCKQSIIFKMHLPYICFRILQYEAKRNEMGNEWSAIYEDKWMIAHDALNKYKNKDRENGEQLINDAWLIARSTDALLPPIIMSKF